MALVSRIPSISPSSGPIQLRNIKSFGLNHVCCINYASHSSSPFTEKYSIERYQRDGWIYKNELEKSGSCPILPDPSYVRDYDIALQLPELKKMLQVLKEKREEEGGCDERGPGNVFLVGTGPGDPELLTVKALRVIQNADLLLYDRLVSNQVLDLVGPHARLLYVGKTAGYHSRTQEEIHELLLSFAEAGANVVRLKGGDPLVFGRGGEEMDFLQQKGIQVKVIPGITAASGISAELGIPLTHRGVANSVRFLTGHSRKGGTDPLFVAENAADPDSTLVVYMGLSTLPSLASKLIHHGLPTDTPAVAIERGTTPQQRMVFAELKNLAEDIASHRLESPTLIIIGKVVALSPLWPHSAEETPIFVETQSSSQHTAIEHPAEHMIDPKSSSLSCSEARHCCMLNDAPDQFFSECAVKSSTIEAISFRGAMAEFGGKSPASMNSKGSDVYSHSNNLATPTLFSRANT